MTKELFKIRVYQVNRPNIFKEVLIEKEVPFKQASIERIGLVVDEMIRKLLRKNRKALLKN